MKNKKLSALAFIIVLILVVAPYAVGKMIRSNIEKQAAQLSKIPGYSLEIREYHQGWFTSRAIISYGFDEHTLNIMAKSKTQDPVLFDLIKQGLVFDITIAHGPITFQNDINLALMTAQGKLQESNNPEYLKLKNQLGVDEPLNLFIKISFNGFSNIDAHLAAFEYDGQTSKGKKIKTRFEGMDITASINSALDEYHITLLAPKLSIFPETGEFSLLHLNMSSKGTRLNDYLWLGNGTFSIGQVRLIDTDLSHDVTFKNIASAYDLDKENDTLLKLKWKNSIDRITEHDVDIQNITLDTALHHLDVAAVTDYIKSINLLYQKDATPEKMATQMQLIATRTGEKLIKRSPEFIIHRLNFLMGDGFLESDGKISINGENLENIQKLSDPIALNRRLAAGLNIKFDKAMAQALTAIGLRKQLAAGGIDVSTMPKEQLAQMTAVQTSAALQTFIRQGYLQSEGEEYSTHFDMKNGQRLINGKSLAIPGL